jgi:hypothetical protein
MRKQKKPKEVMAEISQIWKISLRELKGIQSNSTQRRVHKDTT